MGEGAELLRGRGLQGDGEVDDGCGGPAVIVACGEWSCSAPVRRMPPAGATDSAGPVERATAARACGVPGALRAMSLRSRGWPAAWAVAARDISEAVFAERSSGE